MYNMLISIKPEYVENIFNGSKKYEYRKIRCKQDINKIIIYSTYPIMKVVGEAKVEKILEDSPDRIWEKTKKYSGIDLNFYQKYFKDRSKAIAYKLTNIKKYDSPKELSSYGIKAAPQSFVYIQI
ncbi:MAG: hypothetical protein EGQ16_01895 [Clostridiales bacterium]|nr:hypothetical protein [Clostridiales bacterium]